MVNRKMSGFCATRARQLRSVLFALVAAQLAYAGLLWADRAAAQAPLFTDSAPLAMELTVDLDAICRDPEVLDCSDVPARLSYGTAGGTQHQFDVLLKTRGRGSVRTSGCAFPSLFVRFRPEQTRGTLFAGQPVLPFTTHCLNHSNAYHDYLKVEYLAYRLYNLITDNSLRVRLARVRYQDPDSRRGFTRYGFFTEHFQAMAVRINAELYQPELFDLRGANATELAQLAVFQYMIGNLDWSIVHQHNIVLFRRADESVLAVPFDFDFSGLVDAEYARPPPQYRIRSVRTRRYHGFCQATIDWETLFNRFLSQREAAFSLVRSAPELSKPKRGRVYSYLESFYRILDSRQQREERIIAACRKPSIPG